MSDELTLDDVMVRHGDRVRAALRPSLALRYDPESTCRSRLGGSRMLVLPGEAWPLHAGEPMTLLAQIGFGECAGLVEGLPKTGVLQAFISVEDLPTMGEADLVQGAARLRILPSEGLVWIESPAERPGYAVSFEVVQTMSDRALDELPDEASAVVSDAFHPDGHRMMGHPSAIQYDPFDYPDQYDPRANRVLALQIDGDPRLGWHWVDHGVLHFLADGSALAEGRVEDAIFDMQFI